jgi:tetratricopeptide (TPR) repeat protein
MKIVTQLLAVAILTACAVITYVQVQVWKDTATLFGHVLAIDPRGQVPNLNLGVEYERRGRLLDAQQYVERAVFYKPEPLVLSYSAYCLMQTMMQTHDMRNLPLAGQRLEQALRAYPDDPQTLANIALWSALMGRPRDEETYSRKAIAAKPDLIIPRLYLGDALREQGKLDDAVQTYRQILAIDPSLYDVHNSLGNLLNRQGLAREALKEYQLSLAIKSDQAMPHFKIGMILAAAHQLPQAVEEFTHSLRIDPANANAHNDLGAALSQLGEYDKAVEQFAAAIRIDPALTRARQNLEVARALMKNKNLARERK